MLGWGGAGWGGVVDSLTLTVSRSSMPRFTFIVRTLEPGDGGWHRWAGYWGNAEDAWKFVIGMWPLLVLSNDCEVGPVTVEVVRTIRF